MKEYVLNNITYNAMLPTVKLAKFKHILDFY